MLTTTPASPPDRCDIAIVGGGIVGLATARQMRERFPGLSVTVFEKEPVVAAHQTSHNSGVIHRGIYYAPESLKARLCRSGATAMVEYCEAHDIPVMQCGKLVVATRRAEILQLDELERRATANGVPVVRLSAARLRDVEPECHGIEALHSPTTAITDFSQVARTIAAEIVAAGATVVTSCGISGKRDTSEGVALSHAGGETLARHAIVCAGTWADDVARRFGASRWPRIVPFRGRYLQLRPERQHLVRGLVYPVPDISLPFLGVHFTRHIDGGVTLGPTALPALTRDVVHPSPSLRHLLWPGMAAMAWRWHHAARVEIRHALSRAAVVKAASRMIPLRTGDVVSGESGIRAQAMQSNGRLLDDFAFDVGERVIHVRNAPSPAATASFAIARHIVEMAAVEWQLA